MSGGWVTVGCILVVGGYGWWACLPAYSRWQRARGVV